jgi:hypothetical protein
MERESGVDGGAERLGEPGGRLARTGGSMDVLILAAEPGIDVPLRTSAYGAMTAARPPAAGRTPERLALYLLRLLSGVLIGGAAMLGTTRWTHLDSGVVKDAFFGVLLAIMTLVAAAAGFYYGAGDHRSGPGDPQ